MTAWRLHWWHVSAVPTQKHAKSLKYCSFSWHPVLGAEFRFCSASPLTWGTDSYSNFILHLFLSVLFPPISAIPKECWKCSLQLWKRAARAGVMGWSSVSEGSGFCCHLLLQTCWCHRGLTQWVVLISVSKTAYLNIYLWEKEGKGIFKLNVKISAGKHLKET